MQLKHDDEETSWEEHGYVRALDGDDNVLFEDKDYQHNRQGGWRDAARTKTVVSGVVTAAKL